MVKKSPPKKKGAEVGRQKKVCQCVILRFSVVVFLVYFVSVEVVLISKTNYLRNVSLWSFCSFSF